VPRRPGDDRVEVPADRVPGFERRHLDLDLDPAAPREVSHPRVGLDTEHRAAGRLELPGFDAGAAADVQDIGPGAAGDDPLHRAAGVGGHARRRPVLHWLSFVPAAGGKIVQVAYAICADGSTHGHPRQ
jgi:hypothetical protein